MGAGNMFPNAKCAFKEFWKGQPYNKTANQYHEFEVPAGKLWQLTNVVMDAVDSSTIIVRWKDKYDRVMGIVLYASATTSPVAGPEQTNDQNFKEFLLSEGSKVRFEFGTAQTTGGDQIYLQVLEFDLKEVRGQAKN